MIIDFLYILFTHEDLDGRRHNSGGPYDFGFGTIAYACKGKDLHH